MPLCSDETHKILYSDGKPPLPTVFDKAERMNAKRPLKTYSRLRRRNLAPESEHKNEHGFGLGRVEKRDDGDKSRNSSISSGGGSDRDSKDNDDIEEENGRHKRKRRRVSCCSARTGNAVSAVGRLQGAEMVGGGGIAKRAVRGGSSDSGAGVTAADVVVTALGSEGSGGSDLSEGVYDAMRRECVLSSTPPPPAPLPAPPGASSRRVGDFGSLSSMAATPPSSPPPLLVRKSPAVDANCKAGREVCLGEADGRGIEHGGGFADENALALPMTSNTITAATKATKTTIATDAAKTEPLAHRSSNIPSKAFSFIGRRNTRAKVGVRAKAPLQKQNRRSQLTQLRIDLGNEVRKTCRICGMDYIASNAEDAALHKRFHSMNVGGVDVPKWFVDGGGNSDAAPKRLWSKGAHGAGAAVSVVVVDRRDSAATRNVAMKVIDIANKELSAVQLDDKELWGRVGMADDVKHGKEGDKTMIGLESGRQKDMTAEKTGLEKDRWDRISKGADRYKAYLYLHGQKCVGLCLAERISKACRILPSTQAKEASIQSRTSGQTVSALLDEAAHPAIMGVSRIWTSSKHRRQGIAKKLLDCAANTFLYGMTIERDLVAFSQPTEYGYRLASNWFGKTDGWHIYT